MTLVELIPLVARLFSGALGTFFAILLWSRTRDVAWVLVIIGTLIAYAGIVYSTLKFFTIIVEEPVVIAGIHLIELVVENLPSCLYALGFIVMIRRKRLQF